MIHSILGKAWGLVEGELRREGAYLLPLRLFIGTGWIRASLEKIIEPDWRAGIALAEFFEQQLSGGHVVFPFYHWLITAVFEPGAPALTWIIIAGQFLVGAAVMGGAFTNFALLCGLFMNVNFVLSGRVNPSAFYIVIQTVLFVANTGAILGADRLISRFVPFALVVAQPQFERRYWWIEKWSFLLIALLSGAIGLISIPYIRDYSPNSIDDPAMLLLVLSTLGGLSALITFFRLRRDPATTSPASLRRRAGTEIALLQGDVLRVGDTEFTVHVDSGAGSPSSAPKGTDATWPGHGA